MSVLVKIHFRVFRNKLKVILKKVTIGTMYTILCVLWCGSLQDWEKDWLSLLVYIILKLDCCGACKIASWKSDKLCTQTVALFVSLQMLHQCIFPVNLLNDLLFYLTSAKDCQPLNTAAVYFVVWFPTKPTVDTWKDFSLRCKKP